ncbi:MAG: LacI family transcriptional regulator [Actinomycetales bacterium]|nr:LacI family transcriptional regulator [Actinomycetales bacterium]
MPGGPEARAESRRSAPARRPTLADIARRAGVSKGAASHALNGRPGVSELTRQRVLAIAQQLGWSPNSAARALSVARSDAIGLVLARPARMLGLEPFYMEFISGIEAVLAEGSTSLLLKVVDAPGTGTEIDVYRRWWTGRRVDGVIVTDVRVHDRRLPLLSELGMPAVVLGSDPGFAGAPSTATVWTDDDTLVGTAVRYLVGLGHRRLARVSGPGELAHCASRTESFLRITAELGVPPPRVVEADFSGEDGARATRQLLLHDRPPTAIMYENDVMAVAAIGAAREAGISVPAEVSVLAWDDSPLCSLTHPTVSAVQRDIPGMGRQVARLLLDVVDGAAPRACLDSPGALVPRGSTAPPR